MAFKVSEAIFLSSFLSLLKLLFNFNNDLNTVGIG